MKRVPRLLIVAFALSLLVHLIVALLAHPPSPSPENQAEVVSIEHRPATIAVRKIPTPPPPRSTPAPRTASSAPPARKGPGAAGTTGGSSVAPTPVAAPPTPKPVVALNAGCAQANTAAAVAATPSPPDIAPDARASGTSGTALVNVQLDSGGQITNTSIAQSSGNASLDLVAVTMARDARYAPALRDCKPVASAYTFSVKFVAW